MYANCGLITNEEMVTILILYAYSCWAIVNIKATYMEKEKYDSNTGDWAKLPNEPCRFCRQINCVKFLIDDGPEGRDGQQVMLCEKCKRTWTADSSSA